MADRPIFAASLADRYDVLHEIGVGGMATVYLATDVRHDRRVAIKVLHPELSAVLGAERFLAEIKLTAALQHPHILPLFDSGSADGLLFYVMPFVEGETLRARLAREKQLPIDDAVRIAKQVAGALDYAHRHGVIHRDIKPENILLHDGSALVADFGIALAVQSAGGQRMTQTGLSLGTPQYMSPEQAMGERDITARSDVYSLGAVTYEMLVGEPPFSGPTAQAIVAKVMTEDPRPLAPQRRTIPGGVDAAVRKALEKLPADRFASAAEFAAALDAVVPATPISEVSSLARTNGRSNVRLALVAAAAAIGGIALGFALHGRAAGGDAVQYTQRTFASYRIYAGRFAPDGKTLVYSAARIDSQPRIYAVRPDYPEPQPLDIGAAHLLSVSPGGELAVLVNPAYVNQRIFVGTLARVPLGGGAPRQLVDSVRDAEWSPDGSQLALVRMLQRKDRLEYPMGTVLVESSGGYLSEPRFAPDGQHIAYVQHPFRYDNRGTVNVVDLKGASKVLTGQYSAIDGVAWSRDGKEVLFSARANTHQKVVQAVTLGGKTRMVLNGAGDLIIHDVARDGRLLVTRESFLVQTFFRPPHDTALRDGGWLDYNFLPVLSHDGSLLAFGDASAEGGETYSVIMRKTSGGPATRLGPGTPFDFSRDGKRLLAIVPSRTPRVVAYPTGAGTEEEFDVSGLEAVSRVHWAPGEQSVTVTGNEKGQAPGSYLRTLGERGPLRRLPFVRVLYTLDGQRMMTTSPGRPPQVSAVNGDNARPVVGLQPGEVPIRWSPKGDMLWLVSRKSPRVTALDPLTGRRETLVEVSLSANGGRRPFELAIADDPTVYAFEDLQQSSLLFVVQGAR